MNLTIREWQDSDVDAYIRLHNAYHPEFATTAELRLHDRETRIPEEEAVDFVGLVDGEPRFFGLVYRALWLNEPGRGIANHLPDQSFAGTSIERDFYRYLVDFAFGRGYVKVYTPCADRHEQHVKLIEDAGFEFAMRFPVSAIDLEDFDPSRYDDVLAQVEAGGIRIAPLTEFAAANPDWAKPMFDFHTVVVPDIPFPEPTQPMPWWMFDEYVHDPKRYALPGKYIALDGDTVVGVSEIQANAADRSYGNTHLTAVRREYRRRRIANALKAVALGWAKQAGMKRVVTDNFEGNPMLQLNLQLGFRELFAWRQYCREAN